MILEKIILLWHTQKKGRRYTTLLETVFVLIALLLILIIFLFGVGLSFMMLAVIIFKIRSILNKRKIYKKLRSKFAIDKSEKELDELAEKLLTEYFESVSR
ncbi:MAG: hypothetical protein NC093_07190 [Alistipes sp.]|nr:hypothetical protein [Alistipes sp.]